MAGLIISYSNKNLIISPSFFLIVFIVSCIVSLSDAVPCSRTKNCRDTGMPGNLNVSRLFVYERPYDLSAPEDLRTASGGVHKVILIKTVQPGYIFAIQKIDYLGRNTTQLLSNGHRIRSDSSYSYVLEKQVRHVIRVVDFEFLAGPYNPVTDNQNLMVSRMVSFYGE